jgi:hypothetical protein
MQIFFRDHDLGIGCRNSVSCIPASDSGVTWGGKKVPKCSVVNQELFARCQEKARDPRFYSDYSMQLYNQSGWHPWQSANNEKGACWGKLGSL